MQNNNGQMMNQDGARNYNQMHQQQFSRPDSSSRQMNALPVQQTMQQRMQQICRPMMQQPEQHRMNQMNAQSMVQQNEQKGPERK